MVAMTMVTTEIINGYVITFEKLLTMVTTEIINSYVIPFEKLWLL